MNEPLRLSKVEHYSSEAASRKLEHPIKACESHAHEFGMNKIAFGSEPKDGATFTFYRNQRPALKQRGFDLRCVTVGVREESMTEQDYVDEGCVLLAE